MYQNKAGAKLQEASLKILTILADGFEDRKDVEKIFTLGVRNAIIVKAKMTKYHDLVIDFLTVGFKIPTSVLGVIIQERVS